MDRCKTCLHLTRMHKPRGKHMAKLDKNYCTIKYCNCQNSLDMLVGVDTS